MFQTIFKRYEKKYKGIVYKLTYTLRLKKAENKKALIDGMRCRNGTLEIVSSYRASNSEEL